jgi:ferredoxin
VPADRHGGEGVTVDEPRDDARDEAAPKPDVREATNKSDVREAVLEEDERAALTGTFGVPAFALPWIDRLLEPTELRLVAALAGGPLTIPEAAGALGVAVSPSFFERAVRRGIVDRPTPEVVALADFATRLEIWTLFEGWKDLPADVRRALAEWRLARYIKEKRPQVEDLLAGERPWPGLENAEYLLLAEAEALLARAYLWPCDCRALMEGCHKPSLVCLRFDNDRGLGWEISHERAAAVLRDADRHGLMHTGEVGAGGDQTPLTSGAICNCCADCCFPQLAGQALGATRLWPRVRYIAVRDAARCGGCGRCARRCPFGAFAVARGRRGSKRVVTGGSLDVTFNEELCRGCGLCATGCPDGAIAMAALTSGVG